LQAVGDGGRVDRDVAGVADCQHGASLEYAAGLTAGDRFLPNSVDDVQQPGVRGA
jgi:hypothetical protein